LPAPLSAPNLEAYAEVLLWGLRTSRAVRFKNGELVLLRFDVDAVPLAEAVYAALMDAHLHPLQIGRASCRERVS
jgi:aminopeptidase